MPVNNTSQVTFVHHVALSLQILIVLLVWLFCIFIASWYKI